MKKEFIIALIAIILLVGALGYYWWSQKSSNKNLSPQEQAEKAANPFSVKVNPFEGYKNPFAK